MGIALSNHDRGMFKQVTYLCQRNPRTNQPSRAGVSQIVDVEVLDPGTTAGRLEAPFDRPGSRSVFPCEYPGARSLSDLGVRSEGRRDRVQFFPRLRRIVGSI